MPFTRCPSCQASLELPAVVPGGVVACPYCGVEFPVSGRKSGGGRRPASRGRGDRDDYGEERPAPRFRRKADYAPLVLVVIVLVVGVVAGMMYMTKKKKEEAKEQVSLQQTMANVKDAAVEGLVLPNAAPAGDPYDLVDVFSPNDRVTVMRLGHTFQLSFKPFREEKQNLIQDVLELKAEEASEKVVAFENGQSTHEGTYNISSYIVGGKVLFNGVYQAAFKLDGRGRFVPGSFEQRGTQLNPAPEIIGERNFGVMPDHPVRLYEIYGGDTLLDPFKDRCMIEGRALGTLVKGTREGGWRITGGTLEKMQSDMSWTHKATLDIRLAAMEKGVLRNFTYKGEPAELSYAISWKARAAYMLKQKMMVQVDGMKIIFQARVKTAKAWYDWDGTDTIDLQFYKDP